MEINTALKRNPELISVDMDGETVMMDMESGNYFGINSVGSHIWEALEAENTIADIIETVTSHFDVQDGDTVEADIRGFLGDMVEQKLVTVVEP